MKHFIWRFIIRHFSKMWIEKSTKVKWCGVEEEWNEHLSNSATKIWYFYWCVAAIVFQWIGIFVDVIVDSIHSVWSLDFLQFDLFYVVFGKACTITICVAYSHINSLQKYNIQINRKIFKVFECAYTFKSYRLGKQFAPQMTPTLQLALQCYDEMETMSNNRYESQHQSFCCHM